MSVVHLAQFGPQDQEGPRRQNTEILGECRDLVIDRLCASMKSALDRIEADLHLRLSSMALSSEDLRTFSEADRQIRLIRADLDKRFRAVFQRSFNSSAGGVRKLDNIYSTLSDAPMELALVDSEDLSDEVNFQRIAKGLKHQCDDELLELSPRVAHLLGQDEIAPEDDPLGPESIAKVLKDVLWQTDSPKQVKLVLLDRFCGSLGSELSKVYAELNDHLVQRQVLPRLRRSVRRQQEAARTGDKGDDRSTSGDAAAGGDWFADLVRLAANRTPGGRGADAATSPVEVKELLSALNGVQRGEPIGEDGAIVVAEAGGAFANVLKSLRDTGLGGQVGFANGLIIDIVATMFDFIFEDPRVPYAMKGLIARLQIPVLKVALIDRSFFSSKSHPARRLMNQLAAAAEEWGADFGPQTPLFQKAESLITRIQSEFEDDLSVITQSLAELESFLAEQEQVADRKAADMAPKLVEQERRELSLAAARGSIWLYTADSAIPEQITAFLGQHWAHVLANSFLLGGEQGQAWAAATNTMDRLVWSVMPKQSAEDRKELVKLLPDLLRQIRTGLDTIGAGPEVREQFFSVLVGLHAIAVKAGVSERAPAARPAAEAAHLAQVREPASAEPAAAEPATAVVSPPPPLPAAEQPEPELLSGLRKGMWLEMLAPGSFPVRVRLGWISPARTMFLLTNRQGEQAVALTRRELVEKFEAGEMRLADESALIDQAVESVIDNLKNEYSNQT